jgi:YidC/Oxa1 family membrane protein insertase
MSMELRMLLAIVCSFLVFFVYQTLFVKETQLHEVASKPEETAQTAAPATEEAVKVVEEVPLVVTPVPVMDIQAGRTITASTDLYEAEFVEGAGSLQAFRLKKYKEALSADAPMKELIALPAGRNTTPVISFSGKGPDGMDRATFLATSPEDVIDASRETKAVAFAWTSPDGITIVKTYTFVPGTYEVGLEVKVRNLSSNPLQDRLAVTLRNRIEASKGSSYTFHGPAVLMDGGLEEVKPDKIKDGEKRSGVIAWAAFEDHYFATALIPEKAAKATLRLAVGPNEVVETTYEDAADSVAPKTERTYRYRLYFGPKSLQGLRQVGSGFDRLVDFGWFDIIAKPLLYVMNAIYRVIPNYGIAIIVITIIVKLLFWPLSTKSYKSMSQMKRLQPKMAEIREKYKHDKRMLNQEMMNLYKLYKVNPMGGCLPMVLQIPVFFAFYKMLLQSIELRHAPFFLWINDLSAPDRLFHFSMKIPLMTPPYGIPVMTLIMGASMFLQQKMSPPPGDPAQAKMMMFMPIFFTFMFINFPSGLVLYWLVNNILSMAQQYYIQKKTA